MVCFWVLIFFVMFLGVLVFLMMYLLKEELIKLIMYWNCIIRGRVFIDVFVFFIINIYMCLFFICFLKLIVEFLRFLD